MYFFMLGALEVKISGVRIPITAPKQRAVLATLLLDANNEVPIDRLSQYVWDGRPPTAGRTTLQSYIYRLRQLLLPMKDVDLRTDSASYTLQVGETDTDLGYFRHQVNEARETTRNGELGASVEHLRKALSVWRGNALGGVPGECIQQEARFLDWERMAALEELYSYEIMLNNHRGIIPELHKLVVRYPFHETLRALLMLALYRGGRQAEALQNYALIRRKLRDDLGIEPGSELQELHKAILQQVPAAKITLPNWRGPEFEISSASPGTPAH